MSDQAVFHNPLLRDGFAQVPNAVMRAKGLTPQAKCLYTLLLTYAWRDASCFPSQKTLSTDLSISDRYIREILKELEKAGYLKIQRQGLNKPNIYHFLDFYADRNPGSAPERKPSSTQERKGSAGQDRKSGSSEGIPRKEQAKTNTPKGFGVYNLAMNRYVSGFIERTGHGPSEEQIRKHYEKLKRGE